MNVPGAVISVKGSTLVMQVCDHVRQLIISSDLKPGDKLPSEAKLAETYGVSRTVVREAIASLRADGLVEPRRGAGVFILKPAEVAAQPFQAVDHARISQIVELVELRTAVESEAAALAAVRRSASQEEAIIERHNDVHACILAGTSTIEADFALHLAIADATNNPRFGDFMQLIGTNAIPRSNLQLPPSPDYLAQIHQEHDRIVTAISNREPETAREAMREHLLGSQRRYRALLRRDP